MKSQAEYYESLPKKRMGAGCLFFNSHGQVMLVKPNYKPGWEIPGGIVEQDESPRECCQREVLEELGFMREICPLLVVDYSHATDTKTESLMFVFDGGQLSADEIDTIVLPADELDGFAFFSQETLPKEMTDPLRERILAAWRKRNNDGTSGLYLENQK